MRAVIQRVLEASVTVENESLSRIGPGLLILLGIEEADEASDIAWLVPKVVKMRIFDDDEGRMNLSLNERGGDLLVVSQFTLHASTRKGNRPSYTRAARPEKAEPLYEDFCHALAREGCCEVGQGSFGAMMQVALVNDGPVTIIIDSRQRE